MPSYIAGNHIIDPGLQRAIIERVLREHDPDPDVKPAEYLGPITLPDGEIAGLYLRHAADAIMLDDCGQVILITRLNNPGIGKLATPGGFIDNGETVEQAARREAMEETGIAEALVAAARTIGVLPRLYDRPRDIRVAYSDLPGTAICKGDVMMIPTQGVCLKFPGDFTQTALKAGDDAGAVRVLKISGLDPDAFGIPDHLPMIRQAFALLG
jgi:ADP-ribose pyrophosphatase YjhB (NUDIX family)